jgi:hypothetical protein
MPGRDRRGEEKRVGRVSELWGSSVLHGSESSAELAELVL